MLKAQGKTQGQAECAITLLKMLGRNAADRFRLLSDKNNKIHALSKLGLWPFIVFLLTILILAAALVYQNFFA